MQIEDFFEPKAVNIRNFFIQDNKKYYIPEHQRNYAWETAELEDLWQDFKGLINKSFDETRNYTVRLDSRPYFLGGIVLTKKDNYFEVVDGQQRLTTLTIFLKVLRDLTYRITDIHSMAEYKSAIEQIYTYSDPFDEFEPYLNLDDSLNDFFKNYILICNTPEERENYYRRNTPREGSAAYLVKKAHDFLTEKINIEFPQEMAEEELINKLKCYIQALTRYMCLLKIVVQDRAMAYVIFGSLNKRGKDLSESDLIKNELFKMEENATRRSEIKTKWDSVINTIEDENLTEYIRFHYASKFGSVKPRDLFTKITSYINEVNPNNYINELVEESEWYARINSIGTQYWSNGISEKLKVFKKIDVTHSIPLLLTAAVKHGDEPDTFEKLLDSLITFCIRYFTIGKFTVNDLEREIGLISKYFRTPRNPIDFSPNDKPVTKIQNLNDVISYMHTLTPDETFKENISIFMTKSNDLAFYLLNEFEKNKLTGVTPLEHSPSQHVEHIMPKNLSRARNRLAEWANVRDDERYDSYKYRLGNLLILESEINQRASNKDFDFKKTCYADSGLYYPTEIATKNVWDFDEIVARQEEMAQDAINIWNYPEL
ncbi:DUF262 domain-containing HNH endonuclease family protein [Cytobacillus firmus]|nr:DUF262 domain-containing HNH endonuclease family protein [Cytobacillus firmus]